MFEFCRPRHLVFAVLGLLSAVLEEDNSSDTFGYRANFCRCLGDMPMVPFIYFLTFVRGWKSYFWVLGLGKQFAPVCNRCIPKGTTLHTGAAIAQMLVSGQVQCI